MPEVPLGSRSSATPKTACGAAICESATLRTHWVLVVMDHFTLRLIGFGLHPGVVDGVALYAECSNEPSAGRLCRNPSARIMIRCIDSISGRPIFAYSP